MVDEMIAPLMNGNHDHEKYENNEIPTEKISNNNNDNENQALLNNRGIIRREIINYRQLTNQKKNDQ